MQKQQQKQQPQSTSKKRLRGTEATKKIIYGSISKALSEKEIMSQLTKKEQKELSNGLNQKKVLTHEWTCYIRGVKFEDLSNVIKSVTFQLDPSFEQIVKYTTKTVTAPQPFAISLRGYGQFVITITLNFQDEVQEPPLVLTHFIKLFDEEHPPVQLPGKGTENLPPLISEFYDEIVFPNPTPRALELCALQGETVSFAGCPLMEYVRENDARSVYSDEAEYTNLCNFVMNAALNLSACYKRYGDVLAEEAELKAKFVETKKEIMALRKREAEEAKGGAADDQKKGGGAAEGASKEGPPDAKKVALDPPSVGTVVDPFLTSEKEIDANPAPSSTSSSFSSSSSSSSSSQPRISTLPAISPLGVIGGVTGASGIGGAGFSMQNQYLGVVGGPSSSSSSSSSSSLAPPTASSLQDPSIMHAQSAPQGIHIDPRAMKSGVGQYYQQPSQQPQQQNSQFQKGQNIQMPYSLGPQITPRPSVAGISQPSLLSGNMIQMGMGGPAGAAGVPGGGIGQQPMPMQPPRPQPSLQPSTQQQPSLIYQQQQQQQQQPNMGIKIQK